MYDYNVVLQNTLDYFNGDSLASSVWVNKYALRDNDNNLLEKSPEDMHHRLAKEFARIEMGKFKEPLPEEEIFSFFDHFRYIIPQGSVMFGVGNPYQVVSLSNCFVLDTPLDSYNSIMDVDKQLVNISKRRGGCGIDLSNLRPKGSSTKNAAKTSTGIVSWMDRYSHSIREVGQNNRRGALMLTLSIHHPDILDFCTIKNDASKITGANISVKVTNEFLNALKRDEEYELRFPVNDHSSPIISKMVKAKDVWKIIIHSAWLRAEPGLIMWDNVLKGVADCYDEYRSTCTNPCCFSINQDVWVITNNGYKEIKTITKDDLVWCCYDNDGKWCRTSGYFRAGKHLTYKVSFNNGVELRITNNHKLGKIEYISEHHWKEEILIPVLTELKDLKVNDWIYINKFDPITGILSEEYVTCIRSIEPYIEEEVGCIEVEDCHYFSANGVISGNSELPISALESCRLLCLNLFSFVNDPFTPQATFDFHKLSYHAKIAQRLMDDLVDLESEAIDRIIEKIQDDPEPEEIKEDEGRMWMKIKNNNNEGRRTGTGTTALGDVFAALDIKYASPESIELADKIYREFKLSCYQSSVEMARELGPFEGWDYSKEKKCEFLLRIKEEYPVLYDEMKQFGRRNVALLTSAPTGSVSILTQTTSGIEPLFEESYTRRRKINYDDVETKVDFVDKSGDKWENFTVYHPKVLLWEKVKTPGSPCSFLSPWVCANKIDWINRVKLQATIQKHIDHSISSTINLPEKVTEDIVSNIYMTAFESGCKGITIYREGSRSGVLVKISERPKELPCDVHHVTVKHIHYCVLIGKKNDYPFEVFAIVNDRIDKKIEHGLIIKKKKNYYVAQFDDTILDPITEYMEEEYMEIISRLTSMSLRNNTDILEIVRQLEKVGERKDINCFSRAIARVLKKYIPDGTKDGNICECGGVLLRIGGCPTCCGPKGSNPQEGCGYTKCM